MVLVLSIYLSVSIDNTVNNFCYRLNAAVIRRCVVWVAVWWWRVAVNCVAALPWFVNIFTIQRLAVLTVQWLLLRKLLLKWSTVSRLPVLSIVIFHKTWHFHEKKNAILITMLPNSIYEVILKIYSFKSFKLVLIYILNILL